MRSPLDRSRFLNRLWQRLFSRGGHCERDRNKWALTVTPETRVSAHKDGLALLHIPSGRVFVCNRTGARIWQGILKGFSLEAVSEQISREYGLACDVVQRDTQSFLSELERQGLLTRTVRVP